MHVVGYDKEGPKQGVLGQRRGTGVLAGRNAALQLRSDVFYRAVALREGGVLRLVQKHSKDLLALLVPDGRMNIVQMV